MGLMDGLRERWAEYCVPNLQFRFAGSVTRLHHFPFVDRWLLSPWVRLPFDQAQNSAER